MAIKLPLSKGLILATLFVASVASLNDEEPKQKTAADVLNRIVMEHAKVDELITNPHIFAQNVREILADEVKKSSLEIYIVKIMQSYLNLADLEKHFPVSCTEAAASIGSFMNALQDGRESSTYENIQTKMPYAEELIKDHAKRCQLVYYEHFEEELDEDERENAEELGKHFMQHLSELKQVKGICGANNDAEACLTSNPLAVIDSIKKLDDLQASAMVYRTLLDVARDDPAFASLRKTAVKSNEAPKKGHKCLINLFKGKKPPAEALARQEAKEKIKNKLPHNQEFNRLYDDYIVSKCKFVVVDLGRHVLKPMEYDRFTLGDQYELTIKSSQFLYSWVAYSTCRWLVLDPFQLVSIPKVVANPTV